MKLNFLGLNAIIVSLLFIVLGGFFQSYFKQDFSNFSFGIHLHALCMLGWFGLLFLQTYFVKKKKLKWHRLMGRFSWVLIVMMSVSTLMLAYSSALRGIAKGKGLLASGFTIFPLTDLLLFVGMYLLAIFYKKNPFRHILFILLASVALCPPALIRIYFNYFSGLKLVNPLLAIGLLLDALFLFPILFYQVKNRRFERWTLLVLIFPITHLVRNFLSDFAPWQQLMLNLLR